MKTEFPPVHLDFITSSPGPRLLRKMINYTSGLLGLNEKQFFNIIRNRKPASTSESKLNLIRSIFTRNKELYDVGLLVKKIYGFRNKESATDHFLEAQKTSRDLINYLVYQYGFDKDRFGLKDEVKIPDPSLRRMFAYLNPRPNEIIKAGTALRTRFEELRELFLCDMALRFNKRTKKEKPFSTISEMQLRFNNELYLGQGGSGKLVEFYVSLNKENGVDRISKNKFEKARKKAIEMRKIKIGDKEIFVNVNFDTKRGLKKITKLIGEFNEKGITEFDPYGTNTKGEPLLEDRQRFSVVVDGNDDDIVLVHKKISTFFKNIKEKPIRSDHGQNPTVKKRYIAEYKGIPFEIIYHDQKGLINSERHVGKIKQITIPIKIRDKEFNADFNIYDGSAHELYELRRTLSLIFLMFPYEIYKLSIQSEEEYIKEISKIVQQKSQEIVHKLRSTKI